MTDRSACADDCTHPSHRSAGPPAGPMIFGLVAPSGGGKTTVCDHLRDKHCFVRIHVADPLKFAFCQMFNVGREFCEQPLIDQPAAFLGGVAPRTVLEHLGTRLHEVAPLALPMTLLDRVGDVLDANPAARIVVDGIRRQTEATAVRRLDGAVIRMEGKAVDPSKPCDLSQVEIAADYTLRWTTRLGELRAAVDRIVAEAAGGFARGRSLANHPDAARMRLGHAA
jgi:hypothetical protein